MNCSVCMGYVSCPSHCPVELLYGIQKSKNGRSGNKATGYVAIPQCTLERHLLSLALLSLLHERFGTDLSTPLNRSSKCNYKPIPPYQVLIVHAVLSSATRAHGRQSTSLDPHTCTLFPVARKWGLAMRLGFM